MVAGPETFMPHFFLFVAHNTTFCSVNPCVTQEDQCDTLLEHDTMVRILHLKLWERASQLACEFSTQNAQVKLYCVYSMKANGLWAFVLEELKKKKNSSML